MATSVFEEIKFFKKNSKEDHGRNISVKSVSSFREEDV